MILRIDYNNNGVFPHQPKKQNKRQQEKETENIPTSGSRAVEKWWEDERMRVVRKTKMVMGSVWKKIMVLAALFA